MHTYNYVHFKKNAAALRKIVMKRIITSIIVAGIVIYTSVIFEQSFYLIGIPICAIIGGSAYLSKRNLF